MNDYRLCKKCDCFHYDHVSCFPQFEVFDEDYLGDDSITVHAPDIEDAALKYAAIANENRDYFLFDEDDYKIVLEDSEGKRKTFKIKAHHAIDYTADEIEL